ncbi:MAG: hypothetical protein ACRENJ_06595 [Candidatus Eiseniibacteriota bacterium]
MNSAPHELCAERALGAVLVVSVAPQPDPFDGGLAPARDLRHVIELDELARLAPAAALTHVRALAAIALPDRAHDVRRNGAGARRRTRPTPLRVGGRRELALLELADGQIERPLDHFGDVAGRDLVAEQLLEVAQLVVRTAAHRELHFERLSREWLDLGVANMPRGMLRTFHGSFRSELRPAGIGGAPTLNMPRGMFLGRPGWHFGHPGQHLRPGKPLRKQLFDLGLGLVRCRREEPGGCALREVRSQEDDRAQVEPPVRHRLEKSREPGGHTGRVDALGGGVLGQVQLADAVGEHR